MRFAAHGIEKSFATNRVLDGIDIELEPGELVGIVGENGAGKSTLIRILTGALHPDAGILTVDGAPVTLRNTRDGMRRGIHAIYQELHNNLFQKLSVAENLFMLDEENRFGRLSIQRSERATAASELLVKIGLRIDPSVKVETLAVSQQQMVQIASAMARKLQVLILDEPTAALDGPEAERLFIQVRRLRAEGVTIIYVSHRLEEVFELADRILVLRDGRVSVQGRPDELSNAQVILAMVGRPIDSFYPKEDNKRDDIVFRVESLTRRDAFSDISFEVHAGEVLGVGGVLGCGKDSLLRTLFADPPADSGELRLDARLLHLRGPQQAIHAGIGYVSADRQRDGLCLARSIRENVTLASLERFVSPGGYIHQDRESKATTSVMEQLNIRTGTPSTEVGELSGGTQQKVLFGKWIVANPRILLLDEPTRGVDVGAKVEIYRHINKLTADGVAVVLVSSDLPELCEMSDRVLVMREGRSVATLEGADISQENVLQYALAAS